MTETNQQNVPKLRFPGFEGAWRETKLGCMGTTVSGLTYSPDDIRKEGLLVLRSSNVQGNEITYDDCVFVRDDMPGANRVQPGDILICVRNGSKKLIGKNAIIPDDIGDVTFGAFMTILRPKAEGFVSQLLRTDTYKKQVAADLGARINSINNSQLKKYRFTVPPLPEQRKIAGFLGAVDTKIAQLAEKKCLLEDYKKGCMQQLFSQKIRFKEDAGNAFPDWEEQRLGDLFERVREKNSVGNENVLTISAQAGLVSQLDYFKHSVAAKDTSGYYLLKKGDFAYNKSYSKGYPMGAIKRLKHCDQGIVSTLYVCFRAKDSNFEKFYECYFDSGFQNRWLAKITQEGARNHGLLNMAIDDVFEMPVPYPHPDEQRKIADFLFTLDRKIDLVGQELNYARSFKQGLLQKMFV